MVNFQGNMSTQPVLLLTFNVLCQLSLAYGLFLSESVNAAWLMIFQSKMSTQSGLLSTSQGARRKKVF